MALGVAPMALGVALMALGAALMALGVALMALGAAPMALGVAPMALGTAQHATDAAPHATDGAPRPPDATLTRRAIDAFATAMPGRTAALPRHPFLLHTSRTSRSDVGLATAITGTASLAVRLGVRCGACVTDPLCRAAPTRMEVQEEGAASIGKQPRATVRRGPFLLHAQRTRARRAQGPACRARTLCLRHYAFDMLHAAVLLCGCGRSDGSEITESVAVLMHLARHGVASTCFAPAGNQRQVITHITGAPEVPAGMRAYATAATSMTTAAMAADSSAHVTPRDMMSEAARISRGNMRSLAECDIAAYDMLIVPGGFGVAKNLCTFAVDGVHMTVRDDVQRILIACHAARKPMGFICIAPIIAAKVLGTKNTIATSTNSRPGPGLTLTLGVDNAEKNPAAAAAVMFGNTHRNCSTRDAVTDSVNRIVTSPAYMDDAATPHDVYVGVGKCIDEVVAMANEVVAVARHSAANV
jgi:enhancing lycopene biosynthesis protein 2